MMRNFGWLFATAFFACSVLAPATSAQTRALADDDAATIARLLPSVVSLLAYANAEPSAELCKPDEAGDKDVPRIELRFGSGFVTTKTGRVVTNRHLVAKSFSIRAALHDGTACSAQLLGTPPNGDVALLQLDCGKPLTEVTFAESSRLRIGQRVLAIGNPQGLGTSVTAGVVSAVGRTLPGSDYLDFIQTDAAINPGNSGGPLFDVEGRVVGMNSALYATDGKNGSDGLGFALPADQIRLVLEHLEDDGTFRNSAIGIRAQTLDYRLAEGFGAAKKEGAVVVDIEAGSPAEAGGLRIGDVILALDGTVVRNAVELNRTIAEKTGPVPVEILRERMSQKLTISPRANVSKPVDAIRGQRPDLSNAYRLGIVFASKDATRVPGAPEGLRVDRVVEKSGAAISDLESGDVVLQVGSDAVRTRADFDAALGLIAGQGAARPMLLVWSKGTGKHFVALPPLPPAGTGASP